MRRIGFSTGAIAKSDFRKALGILGAAGVRAVELSALRLHELEPLARAVDELDLSPFQYISVHAPSAFEQDQEADVVAVLKGLAGRGWPVVVHPNVIYDPQLWSSLGASLLIENMDRRKPTGRTAREIGQLLSSLPHASLCLDLGHARQIDPTMTEALLILIRFGDRVRQVHLSEVNERSHHDPLSESAVSAFRSVAHLLPQEAAIILEPLIDEGQSEIDIEVEKATAALKPERREERPQSAAAG